MQKKYSLKKNSQFERVYKAGKAFPCKNLILIYIKTKTNELQIGFTVSKKVGKAVVRNKIKRRMKEGVKKVLGEIKTGHHIVITARACASQNTFKEISDSVRYLLKKAELLK
jgi:ribonuclease P protein component